MVTEYLFQQHILKEMICTCITHNVLGSRQSAKGSHVAAECMNSEAGADSVAVKSNGLGPVLAAVMHPGRLFNIVVHVS
jgi:hypothetical protein